MERVALDTTFLIDLQNERRKRGKPRGAVEFLRAHPDTEILLPTVALGEYLEGFDNPSTAPRRKRWSRFSTVWKSRKRSPGSMHGWPAD